MIKTKKILIILFIFSILTLPAFSLAAWTPGNPLVPCDNSAGQLCNFGKLLDLVNNVITFILVYMAVPIAAIMFAYAGFLLVTAGGEAAGARTKAKSIFTNAVIGLILAIACWLIVKLILHILGWDGAWIGF